MRIEVCYKDPSADGRANHTLQSLRDSGLGSVGSVAVVDVYLFDGLPGVTAARLTGVFSDPVAQICTEDPAAECDHIRPDWAYLIEIVYRPGVHDPVAVTAREAAATALDLRAGDTQLQQAVIQTARQYVLYGQALNAESASEAAAGLYNPLIEHAAVISADEWRSGTRFPAVYPHSVVPSSGEVETFDLAAMSSAEADGLSERRLLALSREEMAAIQAYYQREDVKQDRIENGLPVSATDVELEMIAQTWSEHCKHKILNADIDYVDEEAGTTEHIQSIFTTYIKETTEKLSPEKPFLRSVFHDNSGVVQFNEETLLCFKVETHNSPSALDPYGGAITGIVGVNRDILGTGKGARPIFNTNVLCFGDPSTPDHEIPDGLLHPRRVMAGVHRGIIDGGNQSGIPVAAGAFLFDDSYVGKPLVFCGTGGVLPARIAGEEAWIKHIDPGDKAVMVGGRIGKDGIHGATFSSLALDESSPTSAVQIGDPITQKKMSDMLIEARDLGLFKGITDNGAGGLSSSLGEMAELAGGVRIELHRCPLKYHGLSPWEILLSESQERMSCSVEPSKVDAFLELAGRRDVEATVVGEFTDTGYVEIVNGTGPVGRLELKFLHDGLPRMRLRAVWAPPDRCNGEPRPESTQSSRVSTRVKDAVLSVFADPVVGSKESLVRQYDHEVQALSVVKPFAGAEADGPSDGAVLRPRPTDVRGITVTHGICPRYGDMDTYHMAMCAVDEAFRAHIALGGNPDLVCALDNFCWPDPVQSDRTPDGEYKLAQLVRAGKGLQDACLAYGIPLISGKDSMKNDAQVGDRTISVRPTLLVSLMGVVDDIHRAVTTDFKGPGDQIVLIGKTRDELGGTVYERVSGNTFKACPTVHPESAMALYRRVHECCAKGLVRSCHDLSDGGLAVTVLESALGGRLGAEIDLSAVPVDVSVKSSVSTPEALLLSETPSRLLLTVRPDDAADVAEILGAKGVAWVGTVTDAESVTFRYGSAALTVTMSEAVEAWERAFGLGRRNA